MSTIVLMGATGSMGRRIARQASRRGLSLVLAGRELDQLVELAESLSPAPVRAALARWPRRCQAYGIGPVGIEPTASSVTMGF